MKHDLNYPFLRTSPWDDIHEKIHEESRGTTAGQEEARNRSFQVEVARAHALTIALATKETSSNVDEVVEALNMVAHKLDTLTEVMAQTKSAVEAVAGGIEING